MTEKLRSAARQALEALERGAWDNLLAKDAVDTVIALRERLSKGA